MAVTHEQALIGCLLGTAVGDALGLCVEGLSPRRGQRIYQPRDRYHFLLNRGMCSDDTEHTCLVAGALVASGGEVERFRRDLAWRMRWWLLGLPAGIGLATLRGIVRLWLGIAPERSGVFSAGNGPAMRSALLGVYAGSNRPLLRQLVRASTRLTHTDPKAEYGALAVALAASFASQQGSQKVDPATYRAVLHEMLAGEGAEFLGRVDQALDSAVRGQSTPEFALDLGLKRGVTGYVYHTVPVVLQAWLRHRDQFRPALLAILAAGGDTDTTAAILGGIVGAGVGRAGIPEEWLAGLAEWPRSVTWMENLGRQVAGGTATQPLPLPLFALAVLGRNLLFSLLVLLHLGRRMLPPY